MKILDMHDSSHGKYNHVHFVNTVSSKNPKKIIFEKQIYSCGAAQTGRDVQKSSTNLNPKVRCEVLTMLGRNSSIPKYVI
jgi:hypothetical protein